MNTINVDLSTGEALNLPIGRQGENHVTQVIFDFSALKTEFGSGTLSLSVKRPKEYIPYAQTMTISGTNATWLVNETDTGNFGCGEIQLTYTVSGKVAKTVIYKYTVLRSIGADGEYPIPGQTWQEEMEDEIEGIKADLSQMSGLSAEFKQALHNILEKVAYIDDDGQTYLNALDNAMYPPVTAIRLNTNSLSFSVLNSTQQLTATTTPSGGAVTWSSSNTSIATVSSSGLVTAKGYGSATITATSGSVSATCSVVVTQATLSSISCVYTQSGTVYDTDSLDSLKTDLVVTAHWSNNTTSTVASGDYTLSGTLVEGTSTITVSYGGKTTTFNVTVTEYPQGYLLKLSNNDFQLVNGTVDNSRNDTLTVNLSYGDRRRSTSVSNGVQPYISYADSSDTIYYPIPVPGDAIGAIITITPNTQYVASKIWKWTGTKYTQFAVGGGGNWVQGELEYSFNAGNNHYMTVNCKYDNAGTSYPVEPSEITIEFIRDTSPKKYYYDLTDGLSMTVNGTVMSAIYNPTHTAGEIILNADSSRRSFPTTIEAPRCMKSTTVTNPTTSDLSDTTYYPIKIPSDATGVTVSITPSTSYVSVYAYKYDETNHYTSDRVNNKSQTGWAQGTGSLSFDSGDYQYISIASKYDNSGSSYPTDPTALTVTFTTT